MTDTKIKELAEAYIDRVLEPDGLTTAEDRTTAIQRVETASRELLAATQERNWTPVAC
ncbi:MAG: hypothetical protein WAU42_08905 [Solirubrobacteraceae bacterium]